ncbi:MAG TPA: hypothetical protein VNI02_25755 [Blastocatellia bacterium]|jgi:hypothetical protein|nr:hypothetical protein [Blastocatellia bacterium]
MENSEGLAKEIDRLDGIIQEQVRLINEKLAVNHELCELEDDASRLTELLYLRRKKQEIVDRLGGNVTA